ncbi:HET-domain-containing protein [Xylariaceae sp. FL1272]|nr:HET-domain-containing protein [Xylariaceae sp. FL1272]
MWLLDIEKLDKPELLELLSRGKWSWRGSNRPSAIQSKKGLIKIRNASALAARDRYQYIWVDICCIDKTSSAELSEAVNSMYRWGWTLYELIAPYDVLFYGKDWEFLGSKARDKDVRTSLADITGIDVRVIEGAILPSDISIAERMKWTSLRQTTRIEDMAYCLMGLFDTSLGTSSQGLSGLLAETPQNLAQAGNYKPMPPSDLRTSTT